VNHDTGRREHISIYYDKASRMLMNQRRVAFAMAEPTVRTFNPVLH
jgi:hypothetical protein